jgi:hydroxymethylglutaryl-CoA lyase
VRDPFNESPAWVNICEVGPRDGLQNESAIVSVGAKIRYIEMLVDAGIGVIEATSFVHSKAIPQLADAEAVFAGIRKVDGVRYIALVPNERGMDRALRAGVRDIGVFTAASDTFAERNIRMTVDESLVVFADVIRRARSERIKVRASISTAFGCPFEGRVEPAQVVRVASELLAIGADELSIADTIGVATPRDVVAVIRALDDAGIGRERFGLHFHDTRGMAAANVVAALQMGVREFDASAGGLGGCPFAPGATGNVATEDLLYLFDGMGIGTGIDLDGVRIASRFMDRTLGGRVVSRTFRALEAVDRRLGTLPQEPV